MFYFLLPSKRGTSLSVAQVTFAQDDPNVDLSSNSRLTGS